jgi:hypothetical protein
MGPSRRTRASLWVGSRSWPPLWLGASSPSLGIRRVVAMADGLSPHHLRQKQLMGIASRLGKFLPGLLRSIRSTGCARPCARLPGALLPALCRLDSAADQPNRARPVAGHAQLGRTALVMSGLSRWRPWRGYSRSAASCQTRSRVLAAPATMGMATWIVSRAVAVVGSWIAIVGS